MPKEQVTTEAPSANASGPAVTPQRSATSPALFSPEPGWYRARRRFQRLDERTNTDALLLLLFLLFMAAGSIFCCVTSWWRQQSVHWIFPLSASANLLLCLIPIYRIRRRFIKHRRRRLGWCTTCGYDLRASAGQCPECGETRPQGGTPAEAGNGRLLK